MFSFKKKPEEVAQEKTSWLGKLKQGLKRTRAQFTDSLADLILGKKTLDPAVMEELETRLLLADVGVAATQQIINDLTARIKRNQLNDGAALFVALREDLLAILNTATSSAEAKPFKPWVILMVGVNGAGKTTTIGKLAHYFQDQGKNVVLAAGDTFRAAAVEQLQAWGERNKMTVIAQGAGADSAAVIYDALEAAIARGYDILLADTAGRLHTQQHLLEELKKVKRVMQKVDAAAPHETWLVLDAGIGQNALTQVRQFHQALGLTGLVVTKLDGTAKGGIVFAITKAMGLPIRYIGVGEGIEDLRPFNAEEFVDALLERNL